MNYPADWMPLAQAIEREYGPPAVLIIAIGIHESGHGTSPLYLNGHNPFGIHHKGKPVEFQSVAHAFEALGERWMRRPEYLNAVAIYHEQGMSPAFFRAWASVYCPNTPKHPTQADDWARSVERLMTQLSASEAVKLRG